MGRVNILPLLATATMFALQEGVLDFLGGVYISSSLITRASEGHVIDDIQVALEVCTLVAARLTRTHPRAVLLRRLKDSGKRYFRPVLHELRFFRPLLVSQRRTRDMMISLWEYLGSLPGLSEDEDVVNMLATVRSCYWPGCICHGRKAPHVMHVCKGCKRAYYCGIVCQHR